MTRDECCLNDAPQQVFASSILHGDSQIFIGQETQLELYDMRMYKHRMVDNLALNILVNFAPVSSNKLDGNLLEVCLLETPPNKTIRPSTELV